MVALLQSAAGRIAKRYAALHRQRKTFYRCSLFIQKLMEPAEVIA